MIITDVRTTLLTGPSTNDPFLRESRGLRSAAFIEIVTNTEVVGIGETYAGYFCPELVPGMVEFFKPILLGQSPDDIDGLWQRMYHCGNFWCRVGVGTAVLNGIEAALWDLRAKSIGVPVHALLGGAKHEKLAAYATGGPSNYPLDRLAAKVDHYRKLGFHALKVGAGSFHPEEGFKISTDPAEAADLEGSKLDFLRRHAGNEIKIMLDGHMGNSPSGTWDYDAALAVCRAVESYNLFFFEEPLHYTDPWGYARLCEATEIPIAGGECLTAMYEWRVFGERDAFDIGQPDASFTGGLREFMRVAAMLAERGRRVATHSWGAGGSLMQNIHCGFAAANTCILEVAPDFAGLHSEVMGDSFVFEDGWVYPPHTPGLGIRLTDEIKNRYPFVPGSGEFNSVPGKVLTT